MFGTRLKTSIVLMAVTILMMVIGGLPLFLAVSLISLIGLMEFYRVMQIHDLPLAVFGYVLAVGFEAVSWFAPAWRFPFLLAVFLILMAVYVLTFPKYRTEQVMSAFFGIVYVVVMLSHLYLIRELPQGAFLVWLVFVCSWGCDTMAYCVGMLIGKHKMTPVLSPKKSVEGGIGGILGAALIGAVYVAIAHSHFGLLGAHPVPAAALICAVGAVFSQIGDLAASAIKRNHEIKDYGTIFPGHGGVLDRFDSVIVTAPIVYYLILFFM